MQQEAALATMRPLPVEAQPTVPPNTIAAIKAASIKREANMIVLLGRNRRELSVAGRAPITQGPRGLTHARPRRLSNPKNVDAQVQTTPCARR